MHRNHVNNSTEDEQVYKRNVGYMPERKKAGVRGVLRHPYYCRQVTPHHSFSLLAATQAILGQPRAMHRQRIQRRS
jgi:hypothetical protein